MNIANSETVIPSEIFKNISYEEGVEIANSKTSLTQKVHLGSTEIVFITTGSEITAIIFSSSGEAALIPVAV